MTKLSKILQQNLCETRMEIIFDVGRRDINDINIYSRRFLSLQTKHLHWT